MKRTAIVWMAITLVGCASPYKTEQSRLFWRWHRREISDEQYEQRLKELRSEQPWGGIGGAYEMPPEPVVLGDGDDLLRWWMQGLQYWEARPAGE